ILQLPLDVILLVGDYLSLHDKFFLSQTCRAFRNIMGQDWESKILRISPADELTFWAGLAFVFVDYWACPKCYKLHHFIPLDLLDESLSRHPPLCGVDLSRGAFAEESYRLQYHHIQLALKFSRLGNSYYSKYLAALMKKHTYTDASTRDLFSKSYTAEPRIIDSRFFLREEWKISNSIFSLVDTIDIHRFLIPVCPHLRIICGGVWLSRRCKEAFGRISKHARAITGLEDGIESALAHPGQWISVSCPRCPTDCDIKVSKGLNKVKVMAWHDFGIEGSPLDGGWEAHVESGSYTDWLTPGPTLADRNNSVRNIWSD
ncbi:hypothetical protein M441DRAFT_125299, partial [Trichoderma asperellum CBS 433.97]